MPVKLRHVLAFVFPTWWESLQQKWAHLMCRLFGHSEESVQKMWCVLCARCSEVVEEKPGQMVLPVQRMEASTYAVPPADALASLDEVMDKMRALIAQHRGHPERTRYVEAELGRMATLRANLTPLPPMLVERSEFLAPDDWVHAGDRNILGRFAWSRLMRTVHAPWPEEALTLDQDCPRDSPPMA